MAIETIKIKNYSNVQMEYPADAALEPGFLLELTATGTVKKHATLGGKHAFLFAIEDELQGKGVNDAYVAGDRVQVWVPGRGDIVNARLADEANIAIGDFLESNGDGFLKEYGSGVLVGVAIAAKDLSTLPEGSESSATGLYYKPKVQVMII